MNMNDYDFSFYFYWFVVLFAMVFVSIGNISLYDAIALVIINSILYKLSHFNRKAIE